ncbi:MAG: hypothetical protein Q8R37_02865 [Nanoarchaeota archaeon]|nr:hypothetical protein [Nanoarchaeota archaeon]
MSDNPVDDRSYLFDNNNLEHRLNLFKEPTYSLTAFGVAVASYASMLLLSALRPDANEVIQNVILSYGTALGVLYAGKRWEETHADQKWLAAEVEHSRQIINLAERIAEQKNKKNMYSKH